MKERYDFYLTPENSARAVETVRKFVNRHLKKDSELLREACFVIEAEVRAASGGMRRKGAAKWKYGENPVSAYERATKRREELEMEEDRQTFEVVLPIK